MAESAHRVLVVEDDEGIRQALAECIASLGIEVATASDGMEGLEALRSGARPSAVLVDLKMPRLDGAGFLEEMRKDPKVAGVPVISMTAGSARPRQVVHRYLRKPFDLDEIAKILLELCPV